VLADEDQRSVSCKVMACAPPSTLRLPICPGQALPEAAELPYAASGLRSLEICEVRAGQRKFGGFRPVGEPHASKGWCLTRPANEGPRGPHSSFLQ